MQDRKGGCLCGAAGYVLKAEPRAIAICHCTHCQRQSGSLFSFNLVIREADYEQSGETMVYVDMRSMTQYYAQCDIELLPFRRDQRDWAQLIEVLEEFSSAMPAKSALGLQKQMDMEDLLD